MTGEQQLARFMEYQLTVEATSSLFDECKSGNRQLPVSFFTTS